MYVLAHNKQPLGCDSIPNVCPSLVSDAGFSSHADTVWRVYYYISVLPSILILLIGPISLRYLFCFDVDIWLSPKL